MVKVILTSFLVLLILSLGVSGAPCGKQAGGALCSNGLCCSSSGSCGSTEAYCGDGCQSQCYGDDPGNITNILPRERFEEMLKHRNNYRCGSEEFYTYEAFVSAANAFPDFGYSGEAQTREREVAAFLGQTSHETDGAPEDSRDGPYTWGYCRITEQDPPDDYCDNSTTYPCAPGKQYYGRGPIQLKWNYNYGPCGEAIGEDLLNNPDLLETDPVISFKAAIWFWMTEHSPKPSCHNVIIGKWSPSLIDMLLGRKQGYGLTINIINGQAECGKGENNTDVENRIGYYKRYCDIYGIEYGDNLDCYNQAPYWLVHPYGPVELKNFISM